MKTIREMRVQRGITQTKMAEELGVSRPTYIKFENNPSAMSVGTAKRICSLLGCRLEDIFFAVNVQNI